MAVPPRPTTTSPLPDLATLRQVLSVALLCDAADAAGLTRQSPRLPIGPVTLPEQFLLGRARTTLWGDMAHTDPEPYKLELQAVDACHPEDVLVCAAQGSQRSGIWGELLSTAARNAGCVGVIVDGSVRDVAKMRQMQFPVFARGVNPYDSRNRQRVVDVDVPIELDGIPIHPGDYIAADEDGLVIIPQRESEAILNAAWQKAHAENHVRDAIRQGLSATAAFEKFGIL